MTSNAPNLLHGLTGNATESPTIHAAMKPLAERVRPISLSEVIGQDDALAPGSPIRLMSAPPGGNSLTTPPAIILDGPPGTGKTTMARIMAGASGRRFVEMSATSTTMAMVRECMDKARRILSTTGTETLLFIDEIHRFSRSQQDALLPGIESRDVAFVAATTEDPGFAITRPLLSRSRVVRLHALTGRDVGTIIRHAISSDRGLHGAVDVDDAAIDLIVRVSHGDAREALGVLEAATGRASTLAGATNRPHVDTAGVRAVSEADGVHYDRSDEHYDVASAFIKSMRGSDPDAAIHYCARMLRGGEDPRFIARRIVIAAAEEVGLASPSVLQIAVAAQQAVETIGMPEARIILAEAVIAVATAPKSNAAYLAMDRALKDLNDGRGGPVPLHLRNPTSPRRHADGNGSGYVYAHDIPGAIAEQEYLPDDLAGSVYYEPSDRGTEKAIGARLRIIRGILHGDTTGHGRKDGESPQSDHDQGLWRIGRATGRILGR